MTIIGAETLIIIIFKLIPPINPTLEIIFITSALLLFTSPILYWIIKTEHSKSLKAIQSSIDSEKATTEALNEILQLKNALDQSAKITITDNNGIITFVNDKMCEMSKYRREELIGKDHRILNSGYHSKDFFKQMWETISTGNVWKGDIKNKNKFGDFYWVQTTIVPFLNNVGIPTQYVSIRTDITESKKHLDKFENLSTSQNAILNGTNYAIIATNPSGIITSFNKGAEDMLGYKADEVVNKISPNIFHETSEIVAKAAVLSNELGHPIPASFEAFVAKANLGFVDVNEWTYIKKNGEKISISLSVTALKNTQNNITGYLGIAKDISKEKEAHAKLEKTLSFQNAILNGTNYSIISTDLEGKIVAFNKGAEDMLGYKAEEVINKLTPSIIHDYDEVVKKANELSSELGIIIEPGVDVFHYKSRNQITDVDTNEWTYIHKNGKRITVELTISCLRTENGKPYGYLGIANDITKRKSIERELDRLKKLLEQTNTVAEIGGWEADLKNNTVWWSDITRKIHHVDESFNPDISKYIEFYKEGEHRQAIAQKFNNLIYKGQEFADEFIIINNLNEEKWIKTIAKGEFIDGECIKLYGTFQDITERKLLEIENIRNQKSLKEAQRLSKIGSWERNFKTKELYFSEELYHIYGISTSNKNEQLEKEWVKRIHPDDLKQFSEAVNDCIKNKIDLDFELRINLTNPTVVKHLNILGYVNYDADGTPLNMLGTSQDITEQKIVALELQKAKEEAVAASAAKSDFLANMSHEIRTPLNGVIGFSDLLMKSKLNDSQLQYMSVIHHSANSLLDIINDILDFSKIEAGKLALEIEKTDLVQISSQIADIVTYQVQEKKLELLLNISPELPQYIWTDALRLRQVLINLIGNAVKFTEKGEVELKIQLLEQNSEFSKLRFSVRDTGIGIAPQNIAKIFKAFEQEDNSTTRKFGGTGLGLSISNKLLELMGGTKLQVHSTLGEGSTFHFDIAFKTEKGELKVIQKLSNIKKVLLIDDNANNREIIKELLNVANIKTDEAEDGIEALIKLRTEDKYDAIIIDYHMPDMNGIETIKNIRSNVNLKHHDEPIIILSSSSEDIENLLQYKDLNINQKLIKPVKFQQLYEVLAKLNTNNHEISTIKKIEHETPFTTKQYKILVADDNSVNLLLAKAILNKILPNSSIILVNNGLEALISFKNELPDLIFLDIQMPELNGYECTIEIRKLEKGAKVPIIALTAGTVLGEREKCIEIGMNDYVSKPFIKDAILRVLNLHLS